MITNDKRKALKIRYSGRSSDYISPSFGWGCLFKCAYCYMRRHKPEGLSVANNSEDLLDAIIKHHNKLERKKPNQTHSSKWTYDISCNEDFALHLKYHKWRHILDTLIERDIFPTFATKYVNKTLLEYNPNYQARIRFSLMPQELSTILEPNTSLISERIDAVNDFINAGWDVHLNFSPVIMNKGTKKLYEELFKEVNIKVLPEAKRSVKAEVIMLTHDEKMHKLNLKENPKAEEILWNPDRQESKTTSFGSNALRYDRLKKRSYIKAFKKLHSEIIPWNTIRYIF